MTPLKIRFLTGVLAFAGTATGLVVTSGAAYAECEEVPPVVDSVTVDPSTLVITSAYAKTVTVTIHAHDEGGWDDCANDFNGGYATSGIRGLDVSLSGETDYGYASTTVTQISGDAYAGVWQATGEIDHNDGLGVWSVEVDLEDNDYNEIYDEHAAYFDVKHATKVTKFSADADAVSKGQPVTLAGKFLRLEAYSGYEPAAAEISYYFKRAGSDTWTAKGTAASVGATGKFTKQFTAKATGTWAVRFLGHGNYTPSNVASYRVKVR